MTTKRGGARQGAGKATDDASGLKPLLVLITDQQRAKAAAAGRGNASAGIRAALDALPEVASLPIASSDTNGPTMGHHNIKGD